MSKPEFRIIRIINSILQYNRNIEHKSKHKIMASLNTYAIDSITQNKNINNKISLLEDEIKQIKEILNNKK